MLNDRDDKFEGPEESEYHFSDEEVNYEVESESPKPSGSSEETRTSILNKLKQSKRMIVGVAIFIVLVYVVYKMATPTPPSIPTDITPVTQQKSAMQIGAPVAQVSPPPVPGSAIVTTPTVTTLPTTPSPVAMETFPSAKVEQTPTTTTTLVASSPTPGAMNVPVTPNVVVMAPVSPVPSLAPTGMPSIPSVPLATAPPVSSSMPTYPQPGVAQGSSTQIPTQMVSPAPVVTPDTRVLETNAQQLMNQLQTEYVQRINEFAGQNKMMQEQLQNLATRVANMEAQLNQLVQALVRQQQGAEAPTPTPTSISPQSQATPKISYNVQAIIPGRAWLRADNGETMTVAEGDTIKDVGRVTKIDPYDGVVEINTGSKVVSLSYGNAG